MDGTKQNPLVLIILAAIIIVSLVFIIKSAMPKRYRTPIADWVCDDCGYYFTAPREPGPIVCPQCGGEAVHAHFYWCEVHNHMFEAYRTKPNPEFVNSLPEGEVNIPPTISPMMGGMLYKLPYGEWMTEQEWFSFLRNYNITCPEGNNDPKTLRYYPPSEREKEKRKPQK